MGTICHHSISFDGFIAGPDDEMDGLCGFGEATSLAEETMRRIGAILAGRRWYELATERWKGSMGFTEERTGDAWLCLATMHRSTELTQGSAPFRIRSRRPSQLPRKRPEIGTWGSLAPLSLASAFRPVCLMRWRPG
jgi:hypothetical protein